MPSIIRATTTSGLQVAPDNSGSLQLQTNGTTTAVTIDTSQNVGIGTTSPASTFGTNVLQMYGSAATEMRFTSGNTGTSSTDGLSVGIDSSSIAYFYNRENQPTVFGTNNIERMRIDSSGRVTMSAQPRFLANRSSDQTGYNATSLGDVVVIYNATTQNVGSHFSTSTGKFTAPVAGMYVFQASVYSNGGTPFVQAWLVLNGARADYSDQSVSTTGNAIYSATFLIYLNANDSVGYHTYNATNTNQTITANVNHTWFKGYLIS